MCNGNGFNWIDSEIYKRLLHCLPSQQSRLMGTKCDHWNTCQFTHKQFIEIMHGLQIIEANDKWHMWNCARVIIITTLKLLSIFVVVVVVLNWISLMNRRQYIVIGIFYSRFNIFWVCVCFWISNFITMIGSHTHTSLAFVARDRPMQRVNSHMIITNGSGVTSKTPMQKQYERECRI